MDSGDMSNKEDSADFRTAGHLETLSELNYTLHT